MTGLRMAVKPVSSWSGACNEWESHRGQAQYIVVEYGLKVKGPWRFVAVRKLSCDLLSSIIPFFFLDIHLAHLVGSHIINELMIGEGKEKMNFILSITHPHPKICGINPPCSSKSYIMVGSWRFWFSLCFFALHACWGGTMCILS